MYPPVSCFPRLLSRIPFSQHKSSRSAWPSVPRGWWLHSGIRFSQPRRRIGRTGERPLQSTMRREHDRQSMPSSVPPRTDPSASANRRFLVRDSIDSVSGTLLPVRNLDLVWAAVCRIACANWLVMWHQGTALPLRKRHETQGWGPWSVKDGMKYAHAVPAKKSRRD
jgi:hypothetical protein